MEETKKETKELKTDKDRKYNIILGVMIFLFIIIIGISIAWSFGYVHFGKKNEEKTNTNTNADSNITQNENAEDSKDNENVIEEAYEKYDFEWVSKSKNQIAYVENSVVKINANKLQNAKFEYGTPVMACPLPGHDFNGFVVVNDKGEVYICNNIEFVNGAYDVNNITYTKANISEKIIDIAFEGNEGAVPYSGPYFMTETGKVLNKEGKTYEEVNKDHVAPIGTVQYLLYICSDNTFDIPRTNNDYFKVVDDSGINIKGKKIFMDDSRGVETFYIIGEDNKLYNLDSTANGVV